MDLFEFLEKVDDSGASYHFETENESSQLVLKLEIDGGFFVRYTVKVYVKPRGTWEVHGLPDGDASALIEAFDLAEKHGTRMRGVADEYSFTLDDLVDLIAEVR